MPHLERGVQCEGLFHAVQLPHQNAEAVHITGEHDDVVSDALWGLSVHKSENTKWLDQWFDHYSVTTTAILKQYTLLKAPQFVRRKSPSRPAASMGACFLLHGSLDSMIDIAS